MLSSSVSVPFVDLSWQHQPIQAEINQAVLRVVERGDFILGKEVGEFEQAFAQACGVAYGVGVASGTAAIAMGLQACGLQAQDQVLVPANTFVATLIGIIQAGLKPILVDCCAETALIDLEKAAAAISSQTKALVPVHLYGQLVSPRQLQDFAKSFGLLIFEDAAQAHLGEKEGQRAGSLGTAAAFSFYPSKNLGAFGNGGMLVTDDQAIANQVKSLRNYGAPSKYFHTDIGTNSRLDTLQAAILQVKLPHVQGWNQQRNQAAHLYDQLLAPLRSRGISPMRNEAAQGHVYHLYVIRVSSLERKILQEKLGQKGIQTGIHYPIPCHLQPAYKYLGYQSGDFPNAENLCEEILSLPMYPGLTEAKIRYIVEQLTIILNESL